MSLENLQKLAYAFKLSLAELFTLPPEKPSRRQVIEAKILALVRWQNDEVLQLTLQLMETLEKWVAWKGKT